ncbi:hypothetical protein D3C81_2270460 [compost metagenome]
MFVGDERGDHRAVGRVDDRFKVGEAWVVPLRQRARLVEHLGLARGRADLERIALEARGVFHVHGALGDQAHDLVV